MPRSLIFLGLTSVCALMLAASGAPAQMVADPVNCTGYPEHRLYLENQSWWEPQLRDELDPDHPGTGRQGHIHVGTCFPLYQRLSGDKLHLDINLKLHNMTGHAYSLQVHAYGDNYVEVPPVSWTGDGSKSWHCDSVDCEKWVSVDFPLTSLRYGGDHQWNISLYVANSGFPKLKQYSLTRWHATVARSLPEPPADSIVARTRQGAWVGVGGDSWYLPTSGGKYARVGMVRSDVPWNEATGELNPLSGIWRPRINFEKQRNFVWVDPHLHANPPHKGMVVWEQTTTTGGYTTQQFAIDTRNLANGVHRLVFGTGNVASNGTHTGVGVIPFLVRNASEPSPAPPAPAPQPSPPPHHPPSPPTDDLPPADDPPPPFPSPDPDEPPSDSPPSEPSSEPPSGESRDSERPRVHALPSLGRPPKRAKLRFELADDSHEARVFVTVWWKSARLNTARIGFRHAGGHETHVLWRVPRAVSGRLKFCVQAFDRAGNWSPQSCALLKVRKFQARPPSHGPRIA